MICSTFAAKSPGRATSGVFFQIMITLILAEGSFRSENVKNTLVILFWILLKINDVLFDRRMMKSQRTTGVMTSINGIFLTEKYNSHFKVCFLTYWNFFFWGGGTSPLCNFFPQMVVALSTNLSHLTCILQMMYQPKRAGEMVDFETLTLCISQYSIQMCTYFRKDFNSDRVLSVSGKIFDSQPSSVFKLILLPTPFCYVVLWFRKYHAPVHVLDFGACALCKEVES